jgi:hypothetical protein
MLRLEYYFKCIKINIIRYLVSIEKVEFIDNISCHMDAWK